MTQFEAVGLALAGYTLWVLVDACVKLAGASALPGYEISGLMGLSMASLLVVRAVWRRDLAAVWPKDPRRQVGRAMLDLVNILGVVVAIRHLPLAMFYILIFCSPMVTTLLAAAFLGERLEWQKGLAIVAGFAGVAIAVNPLGATRAGNGTAGYWTGYLACAVCVMAFSTNTVWSRKMTRTETAESLTFFSGAVTAVAGLGAMLWHAAPVSAPLAGVMLGTGLFGLVGSLCFFAALKHAPAATVSQYHYSQLLTGAVIAYVFWHERLTPAMVVGAALIVVSGVYTAARSYGAEVRVQAEMEGV